MGLIFDTGWLSFYLGGTTHILCKKLSHSESGILKALSENSLAHIFSRVNIRVEAKSKQGRFSNF
jgi:hypothetical protein